MNEALIVIIAIRGQSLNEERLALMASTLILNVILLLPFIEKLWYALAT
jgi:hypothetical protein